MSDFELENKINIIKDEIECKQELLKVTKKMDLSLILIGVLVLAAVVFSTYIAGEITGISIVFISFITTSLYITIYNGYKNRRDIKNDIYILRVDKAYYETKLLHCIDSEL